MSKQFEEEKLKEVSVVMRKEILKMLNKSQSGHCGGSLSSIDILNVLYSYELKHDPVNPAMEDRDRFIMSKGHVSPALYVTLAHCGYFPASELFRFRQLGALLQGHVHTDVPGVELSTGSLGQGLSVANGIALGARLQARSYRVYCLMGDGEMQEGNVWEAVMTAGNYKLDNLCAIVDYNGVQETNSVCNVKCLEPIADKIRAFGWNVIEIDGHDLTQIKEAFERARACKGRPSFIVAKTIKGKGVSFMEGKAQWHGKAPDDDQLREALAELGESI